jgi:hypothetical protein
VADLVGYPDIESLLIDLLADFGTVDTVTPADLATVLPFIRISRIGGTDDRITDTARVDVDCFQSTRVLVQTMAEGVRQHLIAGPYVVLEGAVIDRITTLSGPFEVAWGASGSRSTSRGYDPIRRFTASYTVTARRPQ